MAMAATHDAATILIADGDPRMRELIAQTLSRAGFAFATAEDGRSARAALSLGKTDLVLLELRLPDVDGFDLLDEIAYQFSVPTIVVSAHGSEADRVIGLQSGADDYLSKPFSPRELVARVEALLRRTRERQGPATVTLGEIEVDAATRQVRRAGAVVDTTAKEFALLMFLAHHPRRAFSRAELLREVWSSSPEYQSSTTVTEHIRRLRGKIETHPARPRYLVTVHGHGYRLDP